MQVPLSDTLINWHPTTYTTEILYVLFVIETIKGEDRKHLVLYVLHDFAFLALIDTIKSG